MANNLYLLQNIQQANTIPSKGLLEYTHFGYMWTTMRTKKIVASHTIYSMLEMEPFSEFLTEETWRKFVHPQDLYKIIQAEEKLIATGKPVAAEYRLITKGGKHIFINHFMQLSISHDNEVKILSILDDITEQKSAEVILEVMNEGFFELDKNFVFKRINAKAALFFQMEREYIMGKCIWEVFPEAINTSFYELIVNSKREQKNVVQDVIFPVNKHWLHVSISPYIDGLIIMFHDIQHEKEAEEKINELNKKLTLKNRELQSVNSELKTFNSIAANDYQETLRHLYTNLEFIITNDARHLSDSGKANLRRAQAAIQKMKLLTDDIVSFSRLSLMDAGITRIKLDEILSSVLTDLERKIKESNAVITAEKLPVIKGYPLLLSLLFYHLLDNALKFTNNNTIPVIHITGKKGRRLEFLPESDKNLEYHIISIIDNGIGFNQDESEKIFNIFYRLHEKNKYRGSGIGLAVCKKIMNLHNGFINASGAEGKCAEFCCYFPVE